MSVLSMEQGVAYLGYFPGALFTLLKGDIQFLLPHSCSYPSESKSPEITQHFLDSTGALMQFTEENLTELDITAQYTNEKRNS